MCCWRTVSLTESFPETYFRMTSAHCEVLLCLQVRSTGPVNALTRQPIKGRKFGGGIRFGEMERDALLAHGSAYLLHDRLHTSSDYAVMDACAGCGSILTPVTQPRETAALGAHLMAAAGGGLNLAVKCRIQD